jgi:hypothetical protein
MRESRRAPCSAALTNSANDEGVVTFDPADDRRQAKARPNLPTVRSPQGLRVDGMDIMRAAIDTYFAPGKTIRESHELAQSGSGNRSAQGF